MSAIAYITDSKMLELHRLNNHKTMNFWRLSNNINFSDFNVGDLVFFLSKDKEHKNGKEKGIVGFGRMSEISLASVKSMWDKYGVLNGYRSLAEFKEAIIKVSKDKKLPKKISGFYLENVTFFQPIYLSECGMKISSNVESYVYLKPEEVVVKLLEYAKSSDDLWSSLTNNSESIEAEQILYALFSAHKQIKDVKHTEKDYKKAQKALKKYISEHGSYNFVQNSRNELYKINDNKIEIVFYYSGQEDLKALIGQAQLYRYYINLYYKGYTEIKFKISTNNKTAETHINASL